MISAMIEILLVAQIAVALGLLAVFVLRRPVRHFFGARLAFGLWVLPVIAGLAVMVPGPIQIVPAEGAGTAIETSTPFNNPAPSASDGAQPGGDVVSDGHAGGRAVEPLARRIGIDASTWLILWMIGASMFAIALGVRQFRYHSTLLPMAPAPELGPDVYRSGSTQIGAALVGAARPRIIVPADFESRFSRAEQCLILEHEREHRRAGHAQLNAFAALVQIMCWMNPLVHFAIRWFRLDQELACDAAILQRSGNKARTYGAALLRAQTDIAAPFGCTWRPANGLQTRIKALGVAAPEGLQRGLGAAGLTLLLAGAGAASWAARPEVQTVTASPAPLADEGGLSDLTSIQLRGVDGQVRVIAEARADIAVEGLPGEILTRRDGSTMVVQVSELTSDVCNQGDPVTQDFTLRVPEGVDVDVEGRMDAHLNMPSDVSLRAAGCGRVDLGDVDGAVALDLGGSVAVNAGQVHGPLTLVARGGPSVDVTRVDGPIELRTAGGTAIDIEAVGAGGRFNLSGGSTLDVEEWSGSLHGGLAGGSDADIEAITSPRVDISVSGSASGDIETGTITELRVEQAADADFSYGGRAERSRVRNRGDAPVVIANPGQLDSRGRVRTAVDPPGD